MNSPLMQQQDFDVGSFYAGSYVKADDLAGKTYLATIEAVLQVEIAEEGGAIRKKVAVQLQGWPAKLLLNKTNYEVIAAVHGRRSSGWVGKLLEVYPDTTFFNGRSVACVRVRVPRPAAPLAAVPGAATPETAPAAPQAAPQAAHAPLAPAASPAPSLMPSAPGIPGVATGTFTPPAVPGDFSNDIPY